MLQEEKLIENISYAPLSIIAMESIRDIGEKVDQYIVNWRDQREHKYIDEPELDSYRRDSFLVDARCTRFGTGEAKCVINESMRGKDVYILVDVCNYSLTYSVRGIKNHMSPDDHFQDLKRAISALSGKARRITVIMPYLYESRQDKRSARESLDCALALQELSHLGVDSVITFDAHNPSVQNATPFKSFDNVMPSYQFVKALIKSIPDIQIDADHLMVISPDLGAMNRAVYLATVLNADMGMFHKRRDYTKVIDGRNPIVAHEFLGGDVAGKDVIVMDDMISSGDSMLDVAKELKGRGANRIILCSTFGLFTNGPEKFDAAYEQGLFYRVITTNLIYQAPEILNREWHISADMSKYIALIIEFLNHDATLSDLLSPTERIRSLLDKYRAGEPIPD